MGSLLYKVLIPISCFNIYSLWKSYRDTGKLLRCGKVMKIWKNYKDIILEVIKRYIPKKNSE